MFQQRNTFKLHVALDLTPNLKWSVLRCVPPHSNISKKCLLCLYEKLETFTYQNEKELLNKRSELVCKFRHANKFLLKNYTEENLKQLGL